MIPSLSSVPVVGPYLDADGLSRTKLQDFERGGIAIGDPTQGMQVQTWELRVYGRDVRVRPYPDGPDTLLFQDTDIVRIGLSWDQNMRPVVVYTAGGVTKLWWYDPTPAVRKQIFTVLQGARDPVVCLDDKRARMRDFSDVLVFYLRDDPARRPQNLYMRAQRDRYGIEYDLGPLPIGVSGLVQAGMSQPTRLRFALVGKIMDASAPRPPIPPYPPDVAQTGLILDFRTVQQPYYGSAGYAQPRFEFTFYIPPVSDVLP